ncbi:MAG: hypothetical protein WAM72_01495 [Xanthobacteraceae bacterium]
MTATLAAEQRIDCLTVFEERCEARAYLVAAGATTLHEAVDGLQQAAEQTGLIETLGADRVQQILALPFAPYREGEHE